MEQTLLLDRAALAGLRAAHEAPDSSRVLSERLALAEQDMRSVLAEPLSIPGQGEAGGEEHARHKLNYQHVSLASQLWLVTHDERYLEFVRGLLLGYSQMYEALPAHVSRDSNPPGKLFHQCLNEGMWLLYAADAYGNIKAQLPVGEREQIEQHLLRPMIDLLVVQNAHDFDVVHNHGIWSVAAAGIAGLVLEDEALVEQALLGNARDGISGGFLAQLDQLFSPDGYYLEGPYYHRFALRPMVLFADALINSGVRPRIHEHRDQIIRKAILCLQQMAFPDGCFLALNDSSKTMGLVDEGAMLGAAFLLQQYRDTRLNPAVAGLIRDKVQRLPLCTGSLALAEFVEQASQSSEARGSRFISDGSEGGAGGIAILRAPTSRGSESMLYMSFGQHGSDPTLHSALDHGHFDGLHFGYHNGQHEVLTDYGFSRWVNIEPKFGGRYTPENRSYAKQSVAHNTLVVDETSHHDLDTARACQHHGTLVCFETSHPQVQLASARLDDYVPGVTLQRSLMLVTLPELAEPLVIDLMRATSDTPHHYDYPLHYQGQLMVAQPALHQQTSPTALGDANGYQHLWQMSTGDELPAGADQAVTWLQDDQFVTARMVCSAPATLVQGLIGANDPQSNLRNEPYLILRSTGSRHTVASVIETHGVFDEAREISRDARPQVSRCQLLHDSDEACVLELETCSGARHRLAVALRPSQGQAPGEHRVEVAGETLCWQGWWTMEP
ncbi:chondroitin lyase [Halomonas sp. GDM18]|nr:chondroitin lyase [Halomonas sp. SF2003]TCJ26340.1 chondroitin lyase [Halomonas sp. GDM18]UTV86846.1 heparinase II/III family protein [Cobetia litoralis]